MTDSVIDGNSAAGDGGGIRALLSSTVILTRTTVSNNSANRGGGILSTILAAVNVTVSGNRARGDGGGIVVETTCCGPSTIRNSTIADNLADSDGDGVGDGGGIAGDGTVALANTVVAANLDAGGEAPDCSATLSSEGYNLIQNTLGCTLTGDLTGNIIGRDPILGPLADNGGPTMTHALIPPSPAIDAGNPAAPGSGEAACESTDQRGEARPQPAGGRCDIGAVENACGNAAVEPDLGEQCDDGNQLGADGCEALCTLPTSCNTRIVVPAAGGTFTGTTSGQGTLGGTCAKLGSAPEQVFQLTPDTSGPASVETCGTGTDYDTALYVRRGSCATGTEVACNDDACPNASGKGLASRANLSVTAGQPYFIVVDGWAESHGNFSLKVTPPPPAAACVSPAIIPAGGGTFTGTTAGTSSLAGSCATTNNSPETVYQWTPAVSGTATIQTCSTTQTTFDTVLYVHAGSCTSGSEVACNDDTAGCGTTTDVSNPHRGSRVSLPVTAGQPYFIVVDGYNGAKGSFSLTVTPPAGTCGAPITLPAAGGVFTGVTSGASAQAGSCASQTVRSPEQVFTWTPTASGVASIQTCGAGTAFDTVLYMRSGNCASGAEVACNDDTTACGTGDGCGTADHHGSRITPTVTAGQPYFIFVDGYAGSCGGSSGAFSLTVTPPATTTLPSGTCGNPTVIPAAGGTFTGTTSGTSALSATCAAPSGSAPEKVFAWTPSTSGVATIQTCGAGTAFDTVVYLRAGGCGGTEIACNDDTSGCATGDGCVNAGHHGSRVTPTVSAGQTYYIVVDGYSGSCGGSSGTFALTVTAP